MKGGLAPAPHKPLPSTHLYLPLISLSIKRPLPMLFGKQPPSQAPNCYPTWSQRRILLFGMFEAQAIHD